MEMTLAKLLTLCAFLNFCIAGFSPIVYTTSGPIQGRLVNVAPNIQVYEFLGIPFAEAPTGELRFKKTVAKQPWTEVFQAVTQPPACLQIDLSGWDSSNYQLKDQITSFDKITDMSEDCLYLNIWVPKDSLDNPDFANTAPFTFIHGGGFYEGGISRRVSNGRVMSGFSHLVVTAIQYRLGPLGFAYQGNDDAPGNMALWDQLEALKWLCTNFELFGADCAKHTIGGNSAGAISASIHLLSPWSQPYFKRAILQSGSALLYSHILTKEQATASTNAVINGIAKGICKGSDDRIKCLRNLPGNLFPVEAFRVFGSKLPVIDGDFLPKHPLQMLMEGNFAKYPIIVGANEDEGTSLLFSNSKSLEVLPALINAVDNLNNVAKDVTPETFIDVLKSFDFLSNQPLLLDGVMLYYWPKGTEGYPEGKAILEAVTNVVGDVGITCPTYKWAEYSASYNEMSGKVWAYHHSHSAGHHVFSLPWMGTTHGSDLPMLFGEPFSAHGKNFSFTDDDAKLSQVMQTYIANFVETGDPNLQAQEFHMSQRTKKLPLKLWPTYLGGVCNGSVIELNARAQVYGCGKRFTCGMKAMDCSFWYDFVFKLATFFLQ